MVRAAWPLDLTPDEEDDLFMLTLEDDTEKAPWMIMGDLQYWSVSAFAQSLRLHAEQQRLGWHVAAMLPVFYHWKKMTQKRQVAPDTFVAFVDDHPRESFDAEAEGGFPPFALEVISPSSQDRDKLEKREAYRVLGVREYAHFWPPLGTPSTLTGHRRSAIGRVHCPRNRIATVGSGAWYWGCT